jgi:hypothetical protein
MKICTKIKIHFVKRERERERVFWLKEQKQKYKNKFIFKIILK